MGRLCYGPSLSWAEFVKGRVVQLPYEKGSMTDIQLKWESLQKRRKDNRIILLYKEQKYPRMTLSPKIGVVGAFQIPSVSTNTYLFTVPAKMLARS